MNAYKLSAGLLVLGVLGAAACSGCPPPEESSSSGSSYQPQVTCGTGTHLEGNTCVRNAYSGTTSNPSSTRRATTLSTDSE